LVLDVFCQARASETVGKTKGGLNPKTGLARAFRLMMSTQTKWRKMDGANHLPEFIEGIALKDGIKQLQNVA
jgi:hypothetical protein